MLCHCGKRVQDFTRLHIANAYLAGDETRNITAVYAGKALQEGSPNDMEGKLYRGEYQLVFVSPEMILCNERWDEILSSSEYQEHFVGLVVDEAHCVKTWSVSINAYTTYLQYLRSSLPI